MSRPFVYPLEPQVRRNTPPSLGSYESYRPYLRVEFDFTCVYCRLREAMNGGEVNFQIDHFLPKCDNEHLACAYSNLLYSCAKCNNVKRARVLPVDPTCEALGDHLEVAMDGAISSRTDLGSVLIKLLGLSVRPKVVLRRTWLATWQELQGIEGAESAFRRFFVDPPVDPNTLLPQVS